MISNARSRSKRVELDDRLVLAVSDDVGYQTRHRNVVINYQDSRQGPPVSCGTGQWKCSARSIPLVAIKLYEPRPPQVSEKSSPNADAYPMAYVPPEYPTPFADSEASSQVSSLKPGDPKFDAPYPFAPGPYAADPRPQTPPAFEGTMQETPKGFEVENPKPFKLKR